MWDLPRPGLEPVSPALAGRFLTTAPPGKPRVTQFLRVMLESDKKWRELAWILDRHLQFMIPARKIKSFWSENSLRQKLTMASLGSGDNVKRTFHSLPRPPSGSTWLQILPSWYPIGMKKRPQTQNLKINLCYFQQLHGNKGGGKCSPASSQRAITPRLPTTPRLYDSFYS